MSEELSQLDKLPSLEEALRFPKEKFNDYARSFVNYSMYCDYAFVPDKINDWCQYLKCEGQVCNYDLNLPGVNIKTIAVIPITVTIPEYCFDIWHCQQPWFSEINYYCLGIFCLLLCLCALILNVVYLPSFTFYGHRHGIDVLFTALAFSDIFLIVFVIYLHCLPYIYRTHEGQLLIYSRIIARTVPYFGPLLSLFEAMSSWILFCLLFERYLYQQYGKHSQMIFSTKVSLVTIIVLVVVLCCFTFLKFFELRSETVGNNLYSVNLTETGQTQVYHDIITHFIKVPLEYFGPLLGYVIFLAMMYASFGEQGMIPYQSKSEKKNEELLKNFIIINEADRENRTLLSVMFMSTVAIISKFLTFVHHVLTTEENSVNHETVNYLKLACQIISVVFIFIKPLFYVYISPSYCRGMRRYFAASMHEDQNEGISISMTFEQTIANQMRESISYRRSIWASNIREHGQVVDMKENLDVEAKI